MTVVVYHHGELRRIVRPQSSPTEDLVPTSVPFTMEEILPYVQSLLTRMCAMTGMGIRLDVTDQVQTASTDCRSVVHFNPEPFLQGWIEAGMGRGYHEVGHVLYDRLGTRLDPVRTSQDEAIGILLLERAKAEGGERRANLLNLVMDRRSDDLQMQEYPGNVSALHHRLGHLMPGEKIDAPTGVVATRLSGVSLACKDSVFVDFAYAIKKRTRPRHAIVKRCVQRIMRAIRRVNADRRPYAHLLTVTMEIEQMLLGHESSEQSRDQGRSSFMQFKTCMQQMKKAERGNTPSFAQMVAFRSLMAGMLKARRTRLMAGMSQMMQAVTSRKSAGHKASSADLQSIVVVPKNPEAYARLSPSVLQEGRRLREALRAFTIPVTRTIHGLTEGEFDLDALPAFVSGQSDVMKIELRQEEVDLAIAVLLDVSGSMSSHGAHEIAGALNEALHDGSKQIDSHLYAFNDVVYDCGPATLYNGIVGVKCENGTNETRGVKVAGAWLAAQKRRHRILLTICDGSPAHPDAVRRETEALLRQGIFPLRILVGVDVAPKTYPVELFFDSWNEFRQELNPVFLSVMRATRTKPLGCVLFLSS